MKDLPFKEFLGRLGIVAMVRGLRALRQAFCRTLFLFTRSWFIKNYLKSHNIRKLQIGSGENFLKGWLNTDFVPNKEIIFIDARKRLPFGDSIFDFIFSEHLIEHIEYKEGVELLRECFRILKPGGRIRVATPDIFFLIELYNNKEKTELQKRYIRWTVDSFPPVPKIYEDIFVINSFFRYHDHKFIYDFKTLRNVMEETGFIDITRCGVGKSGNANLKDLESHGRRITDEFNRLETFVIEGSKAHE